jgi:ATP-binding cassette subfamily F protein 3
MISIRNLRLSYGDQPIFNDISCIIQESDRIGLFGLNGSGKSTLLKAIAGNQKVDGGTIAIVKGKTFAYLPQEVVLASEKSIIDQTMTAFEGLQELLTRLHHIEQELEHNPSNQELIDIYAQLCQQKELMEPEQKRAEAQRILCGLGFTIPQLDQSVQTLSVGWKMRVILATLLLKHADFYLFDEPTNHLDIVAKEWFLSFLEESSFGFMLVCHEKRFLNRLCSGIIELERGTATFYTGNYDDYVKQKAEALARLEASYKNQQRTLKQMQATIDRFRASASKARMAQSMIKKVEKIERITLPPDHKKIMFHFAPLEQSGRIVLTAKDLSYHFGTKHIFSNATFTIERGNKVAIVAANGVGKTTLLNIISGRLPLQTGTLSFGYKVTTAVFDQDQTASLNLSHTVFENAYAHAGNTTEQTVRSMLGSFLFTNEAVNKKASVLSGGERNRLGMVKVLLQNANFLMLDEPTNHLDIPSKDILLAALQALFVSHDHDFVNQLATHIVELTPQGTFFYHGNYDAYIYQKKAAASVSAPSIESAQSQTFLAKKSPTQTYEMRKHIRSLEQKIEKIEREIQKIQESFADLIYGSILFNQATTQLQNLQKEHEQLLHEWERLHDE